MGFAEDFDVTQNIKLVEMLKSRLLTATADLYANLAEDEPNVVERGEILSNMIIITYMLSNRLGLSYSSIDIKAVKKLRLEILEENQYMHDDMSSLLRHLYREF